MTTIVEIRSALNVSGVKAGTVSIGDEREQQYAHALNQFFHHNGRLLQQHKLTCLWVDNTTTFPADRVSLAIPPWVGRLHWRDNRRGMRNKGWGLITAWRAMDGLLAEHEWLMHWDCRSPITSSHFVSAFVREPRALFLNPRRNRYRSKSWLQTTLFAIRCAVIRRFARQSLASLGSSIERHLHEFVHLHGVRLHYLDKLDLAWHDPAGTLYSM